MLNLLKDKECEINVVRMTFCLVSRFLTIDTQESRYGAQRLKKQSMYSVKHCTVISHRQKEPDSELSELTELYKHNHVVYGCVRNVKLNSHNHISTC